MTKVEGKPKADRRGQLEVHAGQRLGNPLGLGASGDHHRPLRQVPSQQHLPRRAARAPATTTTNISITTTTTNNTNTVNNNSTTTNNNNGKLKMKYTHHPWFFVMPATTASTAVPLPPG